MENYYISFFILVALFSLAVFSLAVGVYSYEKYSFEKIKTNYYKAQMLSFCNIYEDRLDIDFNKDGMNFSEFKQEYDIKLFPCERWVVDK
jgi:hypothetical protein